MMMMMMRSIEVASNRLKIGYVIAGGMGIDAKCSEMFSSRVLWVCESSEVRNFCPTNAKK